MMGKCIELSDGTETRLSLGLAWAWTFLERNQALHFEKDLGSIKAWAQFFPKGAENWRFYFME